MQVGCDCRAQVTVDKDKGIISVCLSLSMNTERQSCDQEKGRCGQIFQVGKPLSYGQGVNQTFSVINFTILVNHLWEGRIQTEAGPEWG